VRFSAGIATDVPSQHYGLYQRDSHVSEQLQSESGADEFGANEWLVEELYEKFVVDKSSVDETWWPTLERYGAHLAGKASSAGPAPAAPVPAANATSASGPTVPNADPNA